MTQTMRTQVDADRTLPLVRAIGREVRERTQILEALETRAAEGAGDRELESELSTQRRELRTCERELARLGYGIDADDPHRIVGRGSAFRLDDTQFFKTVSYQG